MASGGRGDTSDNGSRPLLVTKFKGMNQVMVKAQVGLTFASALRAFLRQDPDIIMVGEVRDGETAEICLRAALTGHFVLSTIHTNDALSAVTRLGDMGIEPFLLGCTLRVLEAQRLLRRLYPHCKEAAREEGMKMLYDSALDKVRQGITSLEAALGVTMAEEG
jgi:type II secretory ATPase GspE/PulE/Tfp pilus assembly ATPase PilB-like protein